MRRMHSEKQIEKIAEDVLSKHAPTFEEILAEVPGYDPTKLQILKNGFGTFMWVEEEH